MLRGFMRFLKYGVALAALMQLTSQANAGPSLLDAIAAGRPVMDHQVSFFVLARTIRSWKATWEDR